MDLTDLGDKLRGSSYWDGSRSQMQTKQQILQDPIPIFKSIFHPSSKTNRSFSVYLRAHRASVVKKCKILPPCRNEGRSCLIFFHHGGTVSTEVSGETLANFKRNKVRPFSNSTVFANLLKPSFVM